MGHIVGDGGYNDEIVDIKVHTHHQKQSLGGRVMTKLMSYIVDDVSESADFSLIADLHPPALYSKFSDKPTAPISPGKAYNVK